MSSSPYSNILWSYGLMSSSVLINLPKCYFYLSFFPIKILPASNRGDCKTTLYLYDYRLRPASWAGLCWRLWRQVERHHSFITTVFSTIELQKYLETEFVPFKVRSISLRFSQKGLNVQLFLVFLFLYIKMNFWKTAVFWDQNEKSVKKVSS